jgi:hypothetical protein
LTFPGSVLWLNLGPNPSETALVKVYKVPEPGFGMRGFDVDRHGVAWVTLASGHMASFDRRTCKGPLNGPGAVEGNLCPEGWTFYSQAGWKGRGLWATSGNRTPMHIEDIDAPSPGAPDKTLSSPLVVHFQLRPDPLAH